MPRRWTPEHERTQARILAMLSREERPFADMSPEAVAGRKSLPFLEWCAAYLPEWFTVGPAPCHREAAERRDDAGIPMAECWGSGMAKTTILVIADVVYDVVNPVYLWTDEATGRQWYAPEHEVAGHDGFRRGKRLIHICIGAKSEDSAAEKLDIIRCLLKAGPQLRADYGEGIEPRDGNDEQTDFQANGVRVFAKGTGQSLRGEIFRGTRPQMFVGDDLEDQPIARSRDREATLSEWLDEDVFPRLEGTGSEAVFRLLMNMYGRHCQAERYRAKAAQSDRKGRPLALYHNHPRLDENGESTWVARYSTDSTLRAMAIVGSRAARTQYLCKVADESAPIQPDWFRTFDMRLLSAAELGRMQIVAAFDPSARASETSDYKAWTVLGRVPGERKTYCLHAWIRHASPREAVRELWQIADRFAAVRLRMETIAFQDLYRDLYRDECLLAGKPIRHIEGIDSQPGNKEDRIISTLQGEIEQGHFYVDVRQGDQQRLVDQLCDLGERGAKRDGADSCQMAWEGLDHFRTGALVGRQGMPRADAAALFGLGRRASPPPRPGSAADRFEREFTRPSDRRSHAFAGAIL